MREGPKQDFMKRMNMELGFEKQVGLEDSVSPLTNTHCMTGFVVDTDTSFLLQGGGGLKKVSVLCNVGDGQQESFVS